jgi:hypothetical protein
MDGLNYAEGAQDQLDYLIQRALHSEIPYLAHEVPAMGACSTQILI